jgi:hypothetical protein
MVHLLHCIKSQYVLQIDLHVCLVLLDIVTNNEDDVQVDCGSIEGLWSDWSTAPSGLFEFLLSRESRGEKVF